MWEKNPALFLVLALGAILVGSIITMVLPFTWINTESDRIASVTPYTPIELAGRDVYIREGCNNCHSQTVRPLVSEVLRYGDYSKSGEFVYDRPFLWGSRRTGPDLARVGGKYPDEWHYQHMRNPTSIVPRSNMPAYAFLDGRTVDPELTRKKMKVLGFPFTEEQIAELDGATEMDAIVLYLQKLGSDIPWREAAKSVIVGELHNPYMDNPTVLQEGRALYEEHCSGCHAVNLKGNIGPDISEVDLTDGELFELLYNGLTDSGMPGYATLGADRIWKMVSFVKLQKVQ